MNNLVKVFFIHLVTFVTSLPLESGSTRLSCANGLVPIFTNETFCTSSTKIFTCCHGAENNYEKDNGLKSELGVVLAGKFAGMRTGLLGGVGLLGGITCSNTTTTNLLKTTATGLATLNSVDWAGLFNNSSGVECRVKLGVAALCGSGECAPLPLLTPPTPCHSLCTNILRGCFHTLSENLLLPWKHAVNSVRTAIRLLLTTNCEDVAMEMRVLEGLQIDMNNWREPFSWVDGICDVKGSAGGDVDCFGGEFGVEGLPISTRYTKPTPPWSTNALKFNNPEFKTNSELSVEYEARVSIVREDLLAVAKHLEIFWPLTTNSPQQQQNFHNNQQSDESMEYDDDDDDDLYDDEDDSDSDNFHSSGDSSGFHDNFPDDEDLYQGGNSGDGEITESSPSPSQPEERANDIIILEIPSELPGKLPSSGASIVSNMFLILFLIFVN